MRITSVAILATSDQRSLKRETSIEAGKDISEVELYRCISQRRKGEKPNRVVEEERRNVECIVGPGEKNGEGGERVGVR